MALLTVGSQGPDVVQVQQALMKLGLLTGPADGRFGPRTVSAVVAFQKSKGLPSDGVVGTDTWNALLPSNPPTQSDPNTFARGIDVSHYQGTLDWGNIQKGGVCFAYIKATDGVSFSDGTFASNRAGAQAAGIRRGAYHFYRPSSAGKDQAAFFLKTIGSLQPGDLPPVVDLEIFSSSGPQEITWNPATSAANIGQIQDFLTAVQQGLGVQPMIYTGMSFFQEILGSTQQFAGYRLWLARYPSNNPISIQDPIPPVPATVPAGWANWNFWQYTQTGTMNGIFDSAHPVDLNLFNGTAQQLQQFQS